MPEQQRAAHLVIRDFSALQDYSACLHAMQTLTSQRGADAPDEIWLLQHHAVLSQGQAGKAEHIIAPTQLRVVQSDRGGQVTWHGPGQLVVYFLLDLNRLGWHVRDLVNYAENAMIQVLAKFSIYAYAKANAPGVYVNEQKIGSLGFKIRKGRSYHGLSLNLDCALDGFAVINPCGYAGLEMVRLCDLCQPMPTLLQVKNALCDYVFASRVYATVTQNTDQPPFPDGQNELE